MGDGNYVSKDFGEGFEREVSGGRTHLVLAVVLLELTVKCFHTCEIFAHEGVGHCTSLQ